jgi:hypothetical protein
MEGVSIERVTEPVAQFSPGSRVALAQAGNQLVVGGRRNLHLFSFPL